MRVCQPLAIFKENAMKQFLAQFADSIQGSLGCFDRLLFKGYLPISHSASMERWLASRGVLLKDFKSFVTTQSDRLKTHAQQLAANAGRPYQYLARPIRKDDEARQIATRDGLTEGLICVFAILEQAQSFQLRYGEGQPRLVSTQPRCLCLYFYYLDRDFGLLHVRLQTWFPFTVQIYVNGHSWLERQLQRRHLAYTACDNAFTSLADPARTQKLADKLPGLNWPRLLSVFARRVNPLLGELLGDMTYYWVTDQAEYATDILFRDAATLARLYPQWLEHATLRFSAEDVMTFLGRKLTGHFAGELRSVTKRRWPGARVQHRMKANWIKMYDKFGCVLRIETVINDPTEFRVRRKGLRRGEAVVGWFPMAKRVSNLRRYAAIGRAANARYLTALRAASDPACAYRQLEVLCRPVHRDDRRHRALNPLSRRDSEIFQAVLRGEHHLRGFRAADIARALRLPPVAEPPQRARRAARLNRLLRLLRGHGLIAKIPHSRRWRVTAVGVTRMSAILHLQTQPLPVKSQALAA
jgi:hypothetical protein